ncbi:MAG: hypothetical protein ACXADA_14105 [Candidatus Hodarchaeales archaeon]
MKLLQKLLLLSRNRKIRINIIMAAFVISINLVAILTGMSIEGIHCNFNTTLTINEELNYETDRYPMQSEFFIQADENNTENVSLTTHAWFGDYWLRLHFNLKPGSSISNENESVLSNVQEITFQNTSSPQKITIIIEGRMKTLTEILSGLNYSDSMEILLYILLVFIPSILLSLFLAFSIVIFAGVKAHKKDKRAVLYYSCQGILPVICWLIVPFIVVPTVTCIYYFILLITRKKHLTKISSNWSVLGITTMITSLYSYLVYSPLSSIILNNQELLPYLPVLSLIICFMITGIMMLIYGIRGESMTFNFKNDDNQSIS